MTEDRWSSIGRPGTWQRHECPECGGPEFRTTGHGYAHKATCSKWRPPKTQSDKEQDRQARDARNGDCECGAVHWWSCPNNPYADVGTE